MPEKKTTDRAEQAKRAGKSPSSQAGEFVREEVHHVREGKHGARSSKQAIAIGLSKARRAGVELPPPAKGKASEETRKGAQRAYEVGHGATPGSKPSRKRSAASSEAMKREPSAAASHRALSRQARSVAAGKTAQERSAAAKKAAQTRKRAA